MPAPTTQITSRETNIPGLLIFDMSLMEDSRGYFQEKFHKPKLVAAGLDPEFETKQTNISYNKFRGAIRGFHAEPWDKFISVVTGKVFAAYLDLRKGDSFGKVVTVEITPTVAVFLPRGVGNSFQTLEPDTYYIYQQNDNWSESAYAQQFFVNLADPKVNIEWPIPLAESTMSDRDKNHPLLSEIKPFEQ